MCNLICVCRKYCNNIKSTKLHMEEMHIEFAPRRSAVHTRPPPPDGAVNRNPIMMSL